MFADTVRARQGPSARRASAPKAAVDCAETTTVQMNTGINPANFEPSFFIASRPPRNVPRKSPCAVATVGSDAILSA